MPLNINRAVFAVPQYFPVLSVLSDLPPKPALSLVDDVLKVFVSHLWQCICEFPNRV